MRSPEPEPPAVAQPGARRAQAGRDTCRSGGFVTVAVLGLAMALLAFGGLLAALGAVAVARHRAAAAADLSALAAAGHVLEGPSGACAAAARVARAQAAALVTCTTIGSTVEVRVRVTPPGPIGRLGAATSTAIAGPG